ncbi:MAG: class I SAM-dependent methyltransferase [Gammaproteobacteria bacterium]
MPEPSAAALEHSEQLVQHILAHIETAQGRIGFDTFMDLALYAPGLGYYSAGSAKFGEAGDFVTAPEISPAFAVCVAGQCAEVLQTSGGSILELGAGTGRLAVGILAALERRAALPDRYLILEPSAELQHRQRLLIAEQLPGMLARVEWLAELPGQPINGVIVANEVADALPVERFCVVPDGVEECGVVNKAGGLAIQNAPARPELQAAVECIQEALDEPLPAGYCAEVCLRLPAWVASIAGVLGKGMLLLFDYGLPRRELYRAERSTGTLRCHYRHRAHYDALVYPGLQDITAWVDFTALAEAAVSAGLEVSGFTTQAQFLLAAGLDEYMQEVAAEDPRTTAALAAGVRQLIMPGEMGESIKAMCLTSAGIEAPSAFSGKDLRRSL